MLVYLDTVICIYAVEGAPSFQARLVAVQASGDQPAISDLTWQECRHGEAYQLIVRLLKNFEDESERPYNCQIRTRQTRWRRRKS